MYLSYQIGQGYWGDGGVCPQRGVYDSPKKPVPNAYRYFTLLTLFSNESALLFMSSLTSPSDATLPDLVVFLHGSGDTGAGLRAWVGDRAPDFEATLRAAGVAVAWPDAKPRPYSMFGGALLPTWFDRTALDPHAPEDAAGVAESRAQVTAIISDHRARVEAAGGRLVLKECRSFLMAQLSGQEPSWSVIDPLWSVIGWGLKQRSGW